MWFLVDFTLPVCALIGTYPLKTLQQPPDIVDAWSDAMMTQISPMLAVSDGNAAIDFYKAAFGAELLWHLGGGGVVASLSVDGANFYLAHESRPHGTRSPASAGFNRLELTPHLIRPLSKEVFCGRPTRRTRSWKRGSERSGSSNGSTFSQTIRSEPIS